MKKSLFIIIVFVVTGFTQIGSAQTGQQLRAAAIYAERNKDWYAAEQYYLRLYSRDTNNIRIQYSYAEMARRTMNVDVALYLYRKIARIDNGRKFPLTFYWIGELLKHKQNYKDAKKWFIKFNKLDLKKDKYAYYRIKSKKQIESCDLAQILINHPVVNPPDHLDATINSKQSEYSPVEKDSILYFSSLRVPERRASQSDNYDPSLEKPNYGKVYRSEIKNQKFRKIKALDTLVNSNVFHASNTSFSPDNSEVVFSRCKTVNASDYECELWIAKVEKNKWKRPELMMEPVNQPSTSTSQPNFGVIDSATVLFFSSNRPGGEGGMDIWYCFRNKDGTWGKAINAGNKINTPDDEITPWFVNETQTLYFSSTYHPGLGGFDIFKSTFSNGAFSEPQNAGFPLNSSFNDVYYSQNQNASRLYISSNRPGSFFEGKLNCCNDIYRFRLDTLKEVAPKLDTMLVIKEQLKLLVPLTLYFHNDSPDPKTTATVTSKSYDATYKEYAALKPEYVEAFSKDLKGDKKVIAVNNVENFFRDSLDVGMEDLVKFTDLLQKVLLNGETVRITMKGYCSPLASTDYNINLAKRRISSLRNYFMATKDGFFVKYINNSNTVEGKIIFEDVDIGELKASKVSDDYKDKRNSVYNPQAAGERKIQIIAVSYGK